MESLATFPAFLVESNTKSRFFHWFFPCSITSIQQFWNIATISQSKLFQKKKRVPRVPNAPRSEDHSQTTPKVRKVHVFQQNMGLLSSFEKISPLWPSDCQSTEEALLLGSTRLVHVFWEPTWDNDAQLECQGDCDMMNLRMYTCVPICICI